VMSASARLLSIALLGVVLAGASLSACGQKGQLYLPSQKKSKVPPTQQPQGTPPPGTAPRRRGRWRRRR